MSSTNPHPKVLAYLALAAGVFCIGSSAIFVKLAGVPGAVSAFYRVLIAAIVVVPWGLSRRPQSPSRKQLVLIACGGAFFAVDLVLWNTSLLLTSAATATLLANNAPLWVGLSALLLFREKLSAGYWCGLVLSLAGMAILVGAMSITGFQLNLGDLLAIIAGVFYAGYLLTTQKARASIDTLTFMTISLIATVLVLLVVNLAMGTALVGYSRRSWLALLGLGLITHTGGWLAINYALGHLRAASVSVTLLGQVIVTALLSIPVLGESLSPHQIFGGAIVLLGIYFANQRAAKPNPPPPAATL